MAPASGSAAGSGACTEVPGGDLVEELPELLDRVLLLVRDLDADLVEQLLCPEDRCSGADGQGDRVRWTGTDHALVTEDQLGDVDPVAHLGDVDSLQRRPQR